MIVKNNGKYIRHFGEVRLIPGANTLSEKEEKSFNGALKNKLNQHLVDKREIEIVEAKAGKPANSVGDMTADEAALLIADTFDLELLETWLAEEETNKNRKTVVSAIHNRIDEIKNPPESKVVTED